MKLLHRALLALFLVLCSVACSPQSTANDGAGGSLDEAFNKDTLTIINDDGVRHEFDIYLALNPEQQRRGLMFVRQMPMQTGMLFVYQGSELRSMWMKNTYLSLDIIFARADGTVSSLVRNTEPLSLRSLVSVEPVNYVLELNAGAARRFKIGPNSRLVWAPDEP
jgi:uncharacterized membrane protein (UPF0127 family)